MSRFNIDYLRKIIDHHYIIFLILIFVIAVAVRLFDLGTNPVAISHDELDYVLNGKAIAITGKDLSQQWNFWSLTPIQTETLTSELFPVLQAVFIGFLPLGLFSARILSVLISATTCLVLGLLVYETTKDKIFGLFAALVFAFNPWSILFSHTSYEAPNALLFYLLGIYLLIQISSQKNALNSLIFALLSAICYFIGFYSYHGFKLIFPFLVIIPLIWTWFTSTQKIRSKIKAPFILLIGFLVFLMAFFLLSMQNYSGRESELLFLNSDQISELVNSARRLGFSSPLSQIFVNKYTFMFRESLIRYLGAFNPVHLFVTGSDSTILFSLQQTGYFLIIELILTIVGLWFVFKKYRNAFYLFAAILLVGPIPAAMHTGTSTALRSAVIFPMLVVFIAAGWRYLFASFSKSVWFSLATICSLLIVGVNFIYFFFVFQNSYPIYAADNYFFNERLLSDYLGRQNGQEIYVLTSNSYHPFRSYMFYQNAIDKNFIYNYSEYFDDGMGANYQYGSINWTTDCAVLSKTGNHQLVVEEQILKQCKSEDEEANVDWTELIEERWEDKRLLYISSPIDSRHYYVVFNSSFCSDLNLSHYVYNNSKSDFDLLKLTDDEFCSKWITTDPKNE